MGQGRLNNTLAQVCADLERHGIDYAVVGAVALMAHGYPRFTEDIDLLLTAEGLEAFHRELVGLGYLPAFEGARRKLRSTSDGVPVEVIVAGEYPGDGRPKPVRFPDPARVAVRGVHGAFLPLPTLIELKLASGMSAPHRLKDLADVLELIRAATLPPTLAASLDASVRDKYLELWTAAQTRDEE